MLKNMKLGVKPTLTGAPVSVVPLAVVSLITITRPDS